MNRSLVALRPAEFLRAERRTPPHLLPLWIMSLVALAGYQPGSLTWVMAAVGALALGLLIVPVLGSIAPTVHAYLSLLVTVAVVTVAMAWLPLAQWYTLAWQDPEISGFVAMVLLGAAMVGAVTSVAWALVVCGEALYRLIRRWRHAGSPVSDIDIEPVLSRREVWLRRLVTGALCLAVVVPLPSFFFASGLFVRPTVMARVDLVERLSHSSTALAWPLLTMVWLLLAAIGTWLVWTRTSHMARLVGIGAVAFLVVVTVLTSAGFALEPEGPGPQAFAPDALKYCVATDDGPVCRPPWLFDAPRLALWTHQAALWSGAFLTVVTLGYVYLTWRGRAGGRASAARL